MTGQITFIIGCTACGKSSAGFELAQRQGAEIVVVDSMKVYRRMDIGTAKPSPAQRAAVRYHLVDVVEPQEAFDVARYMERADAAIADITGRGKKVVVVGGPALYIMGLAFGMHDGPGADDAFRAQLRARADRVGLPALHDELRQVDPDAAERIHPNDYRRIERALEVFHITGTPLSRMQVQWAPATPRYPSRFIGLRRERDQQSQRINARVKRMIQAGLLDEVRGLLAEPPLSTQARQAVGYAELIAHLAGECTLDEAIERIKINSRRLAKNQRTWFRRFPGVEWIDLTEHDTARGVIDTITCPPRKSVPRLHSPDPIRD